MPARKTVMRLIADRRSRAATFVRRKKGLMKKARDLATLCAVPVAVVCADPDGGAPDVWETEEGVLDRYRALPAEKRAEHTHLRYLEDNQGKESAKLARVRQDGPGALAPPDAELNKMTLDGLHELLESVDAALLATAERRKALGLPGDDDAGEQHGVPCAGGNFVGLDGYQMPAPANADINHGRLNPAMYDAFQPNNDGMMQSGYYSTGMNMMPPGYYNTSTNMMQPAYKAQYIVGNGVHMDGYPLQMPGNGSNNYHGQLASGAFQPHNAIMKPGYGGFPCTDTKVPGNGNAGNGFPDLAMWRTDEPWSAIVPAGYPYMHMSSNCMDAPAAEYPGLVTGDNFLDLGIAIGGNVVNYVDSYGAKCSANGSFQCSGSSQNSSSIEELHYLSDVADGMRFGYDDTKLQLWES